MVQACLPDGELFSLAFLAPADPFFVFRFRGTLGFGAAFGAGWFATRGGPSSLWPTRTHHPTG